MFDMNNVKFPFVIFPNADVQRYGALLVLEAVGDRPSEWLKNFVQLRIGRMKNVREFRVSVGFPVPDRPFQVVTPNGLLNPLAREESFAIIAHSGFKEAQLRGGVTVCGCSNILVNERF